MSEKMTTFALKCYNTASRGSNISLNRLNLFIMETLVKGESPASFLLSKISSFFMIMKHKFTLSLAVALMATAVCGAAPVKVKHATANHAKNSFKMGRALVEAPNVDKMEAGKVTVLSPKSSVAPKADINVTIAYVADKGSNILGSSIYNKESGMFHKDNTGANTVTMKVPAGTYDMFASYISDYSEVYYVFREEVEITADTTITLAQSEATTPINIRTVDHEGKPLYMPVYNAQYQLVDEGTAEDFSSASFFILNGYGSVTTVLGGGYKYQGHDTDFFVNNVSSRYKLCEMREIGIGEVYWFNKYVVEDLSKPTTVTNDPARFAQYNQKFEQTPEWVEYPENHVPGYYMSAMYNNYCLMGQQSYIPWMPTEDFTTKFYIDMPEEADGDDTFNMTVKPLMGEYMEEDTWDGYTEYYYTFTRGQQVMGDADGVKFVAAGYDEYGNFNAPEGEYRSQFYPGNPAFSYGLDETEGEVVMGAACPINSLRADAYEDGGYEYVDLYYNYVGRYGELRDADYYSYNVWVDEQALDGDLYEMVFNNENVLVDGIEGKNVTTIRFHQDAADHIAPTLQMLEFRRDGKVTDRLETPKGAVMNFAGGDFVSHFDSWNWSGYLTWQPATATAAYAPNGTDSWTDLEVVEDQSKFYMPGFGQYFSASLGDVEGEDEWFDVKITLTDQAGNTQEQVISPAFYVKSNYTAISDVKVGNTTVKVVNGSIVADGAVEVFTMDGRRVDASNLGHGIYVVRVNGKETTKVAL